MDQFNSEIGSSINLKRVRTIERFKIALSFLSFFPINIDVSDDQELGKSMRFFPLIGLLFGLMIASFFLLLKALNVEVLTGIVTVALLLLASRGLHLDGLADSTDGLLAGASKDEALKIMSDTKIGSFGVGAIVVVIVAKVQLIGLLVAVENILPILILLPVYSRWGAVISAGTIKPARKDGLGTTFINSVGRTELLLSSLIVLVCTFFLLEPLAASIFTIFFATTVFVMGRAMTKKTEGLTGDIIGALIETSEVVILITFLIVGRLM